MKIKQIMLTLSAVCVLSFGTAAVLFHSMQAFADSGNTAVKVDETKTAALQGVNAIEILDKVSADIRITTTTKDTLTAHFYGTLSGNTDLKKPEFTIDTSNGTLTITLAREKDWQKHVWFNVHYRSDLKIEVSIPSKYAGGLSMASTSGDVSCEGFHGTDLVAKTASGDINFNDFQGNQCRANTASGDVVVANVKAKKTGINTASGDVSVADSRTDELKARAASGDITIHSVEAGELSAQSASGEVTVTGLNGKAFSIQSTSGDVAVSDVSGDTVNLSTTSGDIRLKKLSGDLSVSSTSGDVKGVVESFKKNIRLTTTSGDIMISITSKDPFSFEARSHGDISFVSPDGKHMSGERSLVFSCDSCTRTVKATSTSGDINIQ